MVKQVLAILLGIGFGYSGLLGITAILGYTLASFLICWVYINRVLQPEEDTIEVADIFKEHWAIGFFNFLLLWLSEFAL